MVQIMTSLICETSSICETSRVQLNEFEPGELASPGLELQLQRFANSQISNSSKGLPIVK